MLIHVMGSQGLINDKPSFLWKQNKQAFYVTRKTLRYNSLAPTVSYITSFWMFNSQKCIQVITENLSLVKYRVTEWNR